MSGLKSPNEGQLDFGFGKSPGRGTSEVVDPEFISIADFCRISGVKRTTAYRLIREGLLERAKIGRRSLIPRRSVDELLKQAKGEGVRY